MSLCTDGIHQSQHGLARRHGHILSGKVKQFHAVYYVFIEMSKFNDWDSFNTALVRVRV